MLQLKKEVVIQTEKPYRVAQKYKNIHQELIDACKNGNSKAQFEIYKLYYKAMYNTSLRLLNDSLEAEDVMQEAFLSAFKNLHSYKEEVSFGAWLKKIVVNRSLDVLKKRRIDQEPIDEKRLAVAEETDSEVWDETEQKVAEVKQVIAQLPENYRVLITLHLLEGFDHDEISEILGMTNANVRTTYSRARKRLQEMLTDKKKSIWMN
ncbi:MAG: RNA polymerase [Bacteroidetes bacterium HGW-Bacteroidetes-4]|jgi:RNA polymerase sigma-70 factor (ECF subfamily)|nr:MAG: RNA polymerase [Bacteroidetes bacterium HGW-Bacteroidetes-4]